MLERLRELLAPQNLVESTTQTGENAAARADQAQETITSLSEQINRENRVRQQEVHKAEAAEEAARILAEAGW